MGGLTHMKLNNRNTEASRSFYPREAESLEQRIRAVRGQEGGCPAGGGGDAQAGALGAFWVQAMFCLLV